PPAQAPALENAPGSVWKAPPLLTSGASAYRTGEFTYQGYVYDDHGAKEVTDPKNPMHSPGGDASGGDLFSAPDGTYDYPSGPGYDENAANLLELRVRRLEAATAFRTTPNTLEDPKPVATAIPIGGSEGTTHPFPFGSNVPPPAFFAVAFRFNAQEPMPGTPSGTTTADPAWWRESAQSKALAAKDISAFHAEVDFAKLAARVTDEMPGGPTGVPRSGAFDRILASQFSAGQGADYATGG